MPLMVEAHLYRGGEADETVGGEGGFPHYFLYLFFELLFFSKSYFTNIKLIKSLEGF